MFCIYMATPRWGDLFTKIVYPGMPISAVVTTPLFVGKVSVSAIISGFFSSNNIISLLLLKNSQHLCKKTCNFQTLCILCYLQFGFRVSFVHFFAY